MTVMSSASNSTRSSKAEVTDCVSSPATLSVDGGQTSSPQWIFLVLGVFPVWMLVGNGLVLLALLLQRNLQTLSNRVIASLAVTDFLLGLLVVPLNIYQLVLGHWDLGFYVCLAWTGSDVILSTASIIHLCAIALHRYYGIAHPLRMRVTGSFGPHDGRFSGGNRRVAALVGPAWGIAIALSIPFVIQGILYPPHVLFVEPSHTPGYQRATPLDTTFLETTSMRATVPPAYADSTSGTCVVKTNDVVISCGIFNRSFAVYSSLVSFFIPLFIMIVADFRSVQILRANIKFSFPASAADRSKSSFSSHCRPSRLSSARSKLRRCDTSWFQTSKSSCYGIVTASLGDIEECDDDDTDVGQVCQ